MDANLWNKFDPYTYIQDNYATIHNEDREIIHRLLKFYASVGKMKLAVDVGTGPNLYPIMLLIPYVQKVYCVEYSTKNIHYLRDQLRSLDKNWYTFWDLIKSGSPEHQIDLLKHLKKKLIIKKGSIYDLESDTYDIASMFFCAESITDSYEQFRKACLRFMQSVMKNGYLVAAFMENSKGYEMKDIRFPAFPVDVSLIEKVFAPYTKNLKIEHIPVAKQPLRAGYTGMILLTAQRI
ncbi:hypothetical protein HY967_04210 [Candidatus Jorgensenbacteria bacterium]|nr:hypothetical protein [Candidatus Jorgensenbacteria bacterium]